MKENTYISMIKNHQFVRFLIVGLLNTLFGYALFSLFIFFSLHYTLASLLATIFGILFNFKTTGLLVFKNNNNRLILKFFLVYTIVYIINIIFLTVFNTFNINMYFSGAILMFPLALLSFILNKKFVFGVKK